MTKQICFKKGVVVEDGLFPGTYIEITRVYTNKLEGKIICAGPGWRIGDKVTITLSTKVIPPLKAELKRGRVEVTGRKPRLGRGYFKGTVHI